MDEASLIRALEKRHRQQLDTDDPVSGWFFIRGNTDAFAPQFTISTADKVYFCEVVVSRLLAVREIDLSDL